MRYEAIARHGLWAGGWMGLFRFSRCGPGGTHGIDRVPEALADGIIGGHPGATGAWRSVRLTPAGRRVEPPSILLYAADFGH